MGAPEFVRSATAYPNPFSGNTTVRYSLPTDEHVMVEVASVLGYRLQTLVDAPKPAGTHEVNFDASRLLPGSYILNVKTMTGTATQRLIVK